MANQSILPIDKMATKTQAQQWFMEEMERLQSANFPLGKNINKTLHFNKRTSSYGLCHYERMFGGQMKCTIFLSEYFVANGTESGIRNTIIHELLHTIAPTDGHKGQWAIYARKCYTLWGIEIKRVDGSKCEQDKNALSNARKAKRVSSAPKPLYIIKCPTCGNTWYRERMSVAVKRASECGCPRCGTWGLIRVQ